MLYDTCVSAGQHPPAQHISECWNSAEFFSNKLLKDFRGVDDRQVAWAKQLKVGGAGGSGPQLRHWLPAACLT